MTTRYYTSVFPALAKNKSPEKFYFVRMVGLFIFLMAALFEVLFIRILLKRHYYDTPFGRYYNKAEHLVSRLVGKIFNAVASWYPIKRKPKDR